MYMAHERRQYILRLLEQRGRIRSAALARELGVTDETIRTDLVALQTKGLLKRVHGGAEYTVPAATAPQAHMRADVAMARLLAPHIPPGSIIYAEACRFTRVLATVLADKPCTFITPSPQLALHLAPAALPHSIIGTGGMLDKDSRLCHGIIAEQTLQGTPPQIAILQPAALTPTSASYHNPVPARWAELATQYATHTFVVAPSANLYANAPFSCTLPAYTLITEDNLPAEFAHVPTLTIPYISADMLSANDDDFNF